MSDFENRIGDISSTKVLVPKQLQVTVRREGVEVLLVIGNTDPIRFDHKEAMRQGLEWVREGTKAEKEKRPTELKIKTGRLHCDGRTLKQVGHWLLAKGSEAKFLAGDKARLDV